jgi:arylsulfatase
MATCLDSPASHILPNQKSGATPPPLVGKSLLPIFHGQTRDRGPIFWEHEGNGAMRDGKWKLVSQFRNNWELYNMEEDRTEMHNLSDQYPERVKRMATAYADWAKQIGVQPWPMPETPQNQRQGTMPSPEYPRKDRL